MAMPSIKEPSRYNDPFRFSTLKLNDLQKISKSTDDIEQGFVKNQSGFCGRLTSIVRAVIICIPREKPNDSCAYTVSTEMSDLSLYAEEKNNIQSDLPL